MKSTKSIFCNLKNGQKSIFELGKRLKLPKMQFHEKNFEYCSKIVFREIDLLFSRVFLPGIFLIFWPSKIIEYNSLKTQNDVLTSFNQK